MQFEQPFFVRARIFDGLPRALCSGVDGVRFLTLLLVSQEQTQECMHDEINCRKINSSRNRLDMRGASARSAQSLPSEAVVCQPLQRGPLVCPVLDEFVLR